MESHSPPTTGDQIQLAVRVDQQNPLHHLWNNNGTWWCHLTVHSTDNRKERVRLSLKTRDVEVAKARRDGLFQKLGSGLPA